jgi:hypothetical protein
MIYITKECLSEYLVYDETCTSYWRPIKKGRPYWVVNDPSKYVRDASIYKDPEPFLAKSKRLESVHKHAETIPFKTASQNKDCRAYNQMEKRKVTLEKLNSSKGVLVMHQTLCSQKTRYRNARFNSKPPINTPESSILSLGKPLTDYLQRNNDPESHNSIKTIQNKNLRHKSSTGPILLDHHVLVSSTKEKERPIMSISGVRALDWREDPYISRALMQYDKVGDISPDKSQIPCDKLDVPQRFGGNRLISIRNLTHT